MVQQLGPSSSPLHLCGSTQPFLFQRRHHESADRIIQSIRREQKRQAKELDDCDDNGADRNVGREEKMARLRQWAEEEGVKFSDKIHLPKDWNGLCDISLKSPLEGYVWLKTSNRPFNYPTVVCHLTMLTVRCGYSGYIRFCHQAGFTNFHCSTLPDHLSDLQRR